MEKLNFNELTEGTFIKIVFKENIVSLHNNKIYRFLGKSNSDNFFKVKNYNDEIFSFAEFLFNLTEDKDLKSINEFKRKEKAYQLIRTQKQKNSALKLGDGTEVYFLMGKEILRGRIETSIKLDPTSIRPVFTPNPDFFIVEVNTRFNTIRTMDAVSVSTVLNEILEEEKNKVVVVKQRSELIAETESKIAELQIYLAGLKGESYVFS